jgi:hypothetical protein
MPLDAAAWHFAPALRPGGVLVAVVLTLLNNLWCANVIASQLAGKAWR